jgi:hypothetical protein
MSDEVKNGAQASVEVQARELGWEPKEKFQGNPENWVPAEEYVKRGENFVPYLQADRRKLFGKIEEANRKIHGLENALSESRESINVLKQFTTSDALKKKDEEIVGLRRQLAEARRGSDLDAEVKIEGQLDEAREEREALRAQTAEPAAKPNGANGSASRTAAADLVQTPEFQQFLRDNPWYSEDSVARAAATAISGDIMQDPANRSLSFGDKLALVAEQTKQRMGIEQPSRGRTKVEGSRGGGGGSGGGGGTSREPSYEGLSAEARAVCDRQAKQMVGPNRAFKTVVDWQKHYAKMVS